MDASANEGPNEKVYIHEFIDIIGHNRANYMHHMTANWRPIAKDERHQLCYGVWGVVGTTRGWPEVVNIWEEDGFEGLSDSFDHEFNHPASRTRSSRSGGRRRPSYRRRAIDRVLVPARGPTPSRSCAPRAPPARPTPTSS